MTVFSSKHTNLSRCLLTAMVLLLASCASVPPSNSADVCSMFEDRRGWYRAARDAEQRWNIPVAVNMAFILQESSFQSRARPPRKQYLGFIPGPRPSNAFGFAQALDSTWNEYREQAGSWGARRSSFRDAIDFVGWYNARSRRINAIASDDAYKLYLAYHEGNAGFEQGTYRNQAWLLNAASRVQNNARDYQRQLDKCEGELNRSWLMRVLF